MSFSSVWNTVYPIIIAILFFELIIIVHEGGHFAAARLMKIKVNEFSIGMGPKIFSFTKGETKYSLRWILFGGYCAMEGEDEASSEAGSFSSKSVPARMLVVVAGALMNLLLGFLIIVCIISNQNLVGTTTVAKFDDNAVSASSGLMVGDTIKSIDGMRVFTATDVETGLTRSPDDTLSITVERNGKIQTLEVKFQMEEYEGRKYVGMDFWLLGKEKTVGSVLKNSAATFVSYTRMVFLSVHDLLVGRYGLSDLSGPVGAVSVVSNAAKTSLNSLLRISAILTINIGLFNLFPIPALDGWRFFLLLGEGVFRKKLPAKWEYAINAAGLAVLLGVMVLVTFSDVTKLF
ncbi:MAG: PDZ domain-containing protein [Clostridiales bacterium]|nr:PDZ domain-containing protein [Clostridiales bacterium]MBD8979378.1 PDZ domain-containing protein [Clostridiales bacterium]